MRPTAPQRSWEVEGAIKIVFYALKDIAACSTIHISNGLCYRKLFSSKVHRSTNNKHPLQHNLIYIVYQSIQLWPKTTIFPLRLFVRHRLVLQHIALTSHLISVCYKVSSTAMTNSKKLCFICVTRHINCVLVTPLTTYQVQKVLHFVAPEKGQEFCCLELRAKDLHELSEEGTPVRV